MSFCLDDGSELLFGPKSEPGAVATGSLGDEPQTAILSEFGVPPSSGSRSEPPASAGGSGSEPPASAGGQFAGENPTRPFIHTTAAEAEPRESLGGATEKRSISANRAAEPQTKAQAKPQETTRGIDKRWLLAAAAGVILLVGGYFGYRYLNANDGGAINSIAVMPFVNESGDPDSEYLSDGLAESLIYRLSQLPDLKVSPTSSVFRYKGKDADLQVVAKDLGVDSVMTGRITQRGESLIISVNLVDTRNGKSLWGEQYERNMSDLLATQREIAASIAEKLQLKLSGTDSKGLTKTYTDSNEAYQMYLKGRFYWNKRNADNLHKAIGLFNEATERDPNFALAYSGLADCYVVASPYTGELGTETLPKAKALAKRAIELDPALAEPHASLALATWLLDWNKDEAGKEFQAAIQLNPNYPTGHQWYSVYLRSLGRSDEALKELKRAEALDPLSPIFINSVAEIYVDKHEFDSAENEIKRMFELDPNFWAGYQTLVWVKVGQGKYDEALIAAQKGIDLSQRSSASLGNLGYVYGRLGRKDDALKITKELEERYRNKSADERDLAIVYAGLGDKDKAFEWLEKAYQDRSYYLIALSTEPPLASLHDDPRWSELLNRLGLSK